MEEGAEIDVGAVVVEVAFEDVPEVVVVSGAVAVVAEGAVGEGAVVAVVGADAVAVVVVDLAALEVWMAFAGIGQLGCRSWTAVAFVSFGCPDFPVQKPYGSGFHSFPVQTESGCGCHSSPVLIRSGSGHRSSPVLIRFGSGHRSFPGVPVSCVRRCSFYGDNPEPVKMNTKLVKTVHKFQPNISEAWSQLEIGHRGEY